MNNNNTLLCMPMFKNDDRYSIDNIKKHLKKKWKIEVETVTGDDDSAILNIMGESISIGYISSEIPKKEYETLTKYSYLWKDCLNEVSQHTSHAVISFLPSDGIMIKKCKIMSVLLEALFATSKAIGVYKGGQSLLIPSDVYQSFVDIMAKDSDLPVLLWVYMAWIKNGSKTSMYTYGMNTFAKKEIEIWDSEKEASDVHNLIINLCSYVIEGDVDLKDGDTLGETEEDKINIRIGKSRFIDDKTVQVSY